MIDPTEVHEGVLTRKREAEERLIDFVRAMFLPRYKESLGSFAEDYLQELAIALVDGIRRNKVQHPEFLVTYCQSVARNIEADAMRTLAAAAKKLVPISEGRLKRSRATPETIAIEQQRLAKLVSAFDHLNARAREVLRRFYFAHESAVSIQRAMNLSYDQFRWLKTQAVIQLRQEYQQPSPEVLKFPRPQFNDQQEELLAA